MRLRCAFGLGLVVVLVALSASACGTVSRPSLEEWQPRWVAVQALVPSQGDLGDEPDRELCNQIHVAVREEARGLIPTPDPALDDAVRDWVKIAEATFFECPPRERELDGFGDAYNELARFAAEVDAVVLIDLGTG
jgi:hypothetical protein